MWAGNNLPYEKLQEIIYKVSPERKQVAEKEPEGPSQDEINNDWRRLKAFMAGTK